MGRILHGSATTTEAVRRAIQHSQERIQHSQESPRVLAERHGINQKTGAKWSPPENPEQTPSSVDITRKIPEKRMLQGLSGGVHLDDFVAACNFGRRLKPLEGLTPYAFICKCWTSEPPRFKLDPIHQMPGLNSLRSTQWMVIETPGRHRRRTGRLIP